MAFVRSLLIPLLRELPLRFIEPIQNHTQRAWKNFSVTRVSRFGNRHIRQNTAVWRDVITRAHGSSTDEWWLFQNFYGLLGNKILLGARVLDGHDFDAGAIEQLVTVSGP